MARTAVNHLLFGRSEQKNGEIENEGEGEKPLFFLRLSGEKVKSRRGGGEKKEGEKSPSSLTMYPANCEEKDKRGGEKEGRGLHRSPLEETSTAMFSSGGKVSEEGGKKKKKKIKGEGERREKKNRTDSFAGSISCGGSKWEERKGKKGEEEKRKEALFCVGFLL